MVRLATVALAVAFGTTGGYADSPHVVTPTLSTAPLYSYDGAPASPDADDPAVWIHARDRRKSLVVGTAKDAGLLVYDLAGNLVQAIAPPNTRQVLPADPPTPSGVNPAPDRPCIDSESGETFGRFNNVDIAYDVALGSNRRVDVAIVSDRGCDRVRFYKIDPSGPNGPLEDITAPDVPRVFPTRYDQPSPVQSPPGEVEGWRDNPVDDQNTVYGLTIAQGTRPDVFVSQRERGLVRQLRVVATTTGRLTYRPERTFLFDTTFELKDETGGRYEWTPCREAAAEEPQSEGLVFDRANDTLYVAFETIGLYKLSLARSLPSHVGVGVNRLIEPVTSFGRAYRATPDDEEFACEYDAADEPAPDAIEVPGSPANAGSFLQADLEGLSIIAGIRGQTLLLASSQGDSSFHFYGIHRRTHKRLGVFHVEGVSDTDGVHYVPGPLGSRYPLGLLVVQNGAASAPPDAGDVNGYPFDGSTQFKYVNFLDALGALAR